MFHVKQFDLLKEFCRSQQLPYGELEGQRFQKYCEMLIETNKVMNLTAVTEPEEIEIRHFIDSLESAALIKQLTAGLKDVKVVDMGSGAGFPGMPLGIILSSYEFLLLDSLNKRIGFLENVIRELGLDHVHAAAMRAEEAGQSDLRESFDICVSRAVADMSVLLEYCLPLVKVGGYAVLYKSSGYREELEKAENALSVLGGTVSDVKEFVVPGSDVARTLIIIRKEKATPIKYPRRPGKPSKSPI